SSKAPEQAIANPRQNDLAGCRNPAARQAMTSTAMRTPLTTAATTLHVGFTSNAMLTAIAPTATVSVRSVNFWTTMHLPPTGAPDLPAAARLLMHKPADVVGFVVRDRGRPAQPARRGENRIASAGSCVKTADRPAGRGDGIRKPA